MLYLRKKRLAAAGNQAVVVQYVEILGHIQAVRAAVAVDFVAAVIHREGEERVVARPLLFERGDEAVERGDVVAQLRHGLVALRAEFVHERVVIAVIDDIEVVFVLVDQRHRLFVDLLNGVANKVVHVALEEDVAQAAMRIADDDRPFARADQRVEQRVDADDRLFVLPDAVNRRKRAGIQRAEADRRDRRHDRLQRHGERGVLHHVVKQRGVLLIQPHGDRVGIVHEHAIHAAAVYAVFHQIDDLIDRRVGLSGGLDPHRRGQRGRHARDGKGIQLICHCRFAPL